MVSKRIKIKSYYVVVKIVELSYNSESGAAKMPES